MKIGAIKKDHAVLREVTHILFLVILCAQSVVNQVQSLVNRLPSSNSKSNDELLKVGGAILPIL